GSDPLAYASSGFLWDNALARRKTFRNFGEFVKRAAPKGASWADMYEEYRTGAGKFKVEAQANVARLGPLPPPRFPRLRHFHPRRLPGEGVHRGVEGVRADGAVPQPGLPVPAVRPHQR